MSSHVQNARLRLATSAAANGRRMHARRRRRTVLRWAEHRRDAENSKDGRASKRHCPFHNAVLSTFKRCVHLRDGSVGLLFNHADVRLQQRKIALLKYAKLTPQRHKLRLGHQVRVGIPCACLAHTRHSVSKRLALLLAKSAMSLEQIDLRIALAVSKGRGETLTARRRSERHIPCGTCQTREGSLG